jgi:transposase
MTYSIDLRTWVVDFVQEDGSQAEASRRYEVSLWYVNDWCQRDETNPKQQLGRKRKLDWEALLRHIQEFPDTLLRERAQYFGVHNSAISYANRQLNKERSL